MERTRRKVSAGGPREVVDQGAGRARLQLASEAVGGDPERWWLVEWAVPHSCADKPGEKLGSETVRTNQGSSMGT